MSGWSRRGWGLLAVGTLAAMVLVCPPVRAADIETRDFVVLVSGKVAGDVHMTIHRQDDGTIAMRCDTDIQVNQIFGKYRFIYRGMEVWKDNRLLRFESSTDDNGKRYIVSASAEKEGIRLRVNNDERMARSNVWLTTYWCLPDPKLRNGVVPLLDADNGRDVDSKLAYVANEKMRVLGREVTLNHYRLTGKVQIDLWYDGTDRLVRQEWVEQGHKTVLELTRVRR